MNHSSTWDDLHSDGPDQYGDEKAKNMISTRAHNLCHDNRQLIVIAINRNRSAIKINCN